MWYTWADFHANIYEKVAPAIEKTAGMDCECVGGGRIKHSLDEKTIKVYGYSQGYGLADHALTVEILKKKYPDYESITFSNDGY
ncbi:hypothetical protein HAZT_HAZT009670 [Hyalella azteca]|uniref:Uncharacterized protein n=1 Tax=Hyalella azteca TaxID=294128 RepID=A0A6A0GZ84_HYAAZ|nr:hypothetical protein HAZT_HAZT009670 [Hyalella azteca]